MASIRFNLMPGSHERQLKRRHENPLFLENSNKVTQEQVNDARAKDRAEVEQFHTDFQKLMNDATQLKPNVDTEIIFRMKADIDRLYEKSAGLMDNHGQFQSALIKLMTVIMNTLRGNSENDDLANLELDKEALARKTHYAVLNHAVVADILRSDSPIQKDELIPSLLTESEPAALAAFSIFDTEQQKQIISDTEQWLKQVTGADDRVKNAFEILTAIQRFQGKDHNISH